MQYREIAEMVAEFGYPYAYRYFPASEDKAPPFVVYYYDGADDFFADDRNYQRIVPLVIEAYFDNKDFEAEARIESVLDAHGITYSKEEIYIESERMYEIFYEAEVIINV